MSKVKQHIIRIAIYAACLVLWEMLARIINPIFLVGPLSVMKAGYRLCVETGLIWPAFGTTVLELVVALILSAVLGMAAGAALGLSDSIRFMAEPAVNALYSVPRIVFVPLMILWFGIGFSAKVAIAVSLGVFPMLISTAAGFRIAGRRYAEVIAVFGGTRRQEVFMAVLPGAVPHIVSGLQLTAGLTLIGVVVAEMFTSLEGLGGLLIEAGHNFRTDDLLFTTCVLAGLGWLVIKAVTEFPLRLAPWLRKAH